MNPGHFDPCDGCEFRDSPLVCHARTVGHRAFCGDPKYRRYLREKTTGRPDQPPTPGDGAAKVGLVCPCLNMGGAEAWQLALARHCDPARVRFVGCAVADERHGFDPAMLEATRALMPVAWGHEAVRSLAARCDVLVTWAVPNLPAALDGLPRRPKIVAACHAPEESPWGRDVYGRTSGVDRWVAVSELALEAIPPAAREATPTSVIWNAVDPPRLEVRRSREEMRQSWGVPAGARVAGYLGRLAAEKDPHAMRRALDALPSDWHCVLVGAGCEEIRPHPRMHLVGPDPAAGDVLNAFDVLVVPSHYESFGLTIAEGLWMGVPVVSTAAGIARIRRGLTYPVPPDAPGPVLEEVARLAARLGPLPGSREWARENLAPERFGREWTDLILEVAPKLDPTRSNSIQLDPTRHLPDTSPTPGATPVARGPGLLSQAGSFAGAAVRHVADGARKVTPEVRMARLAECLSCSEHDSEVDGCRSCGCGIRVKGGLSLKRSWASERCPLDPPRWDAV